MTTNKTNKVIRGMLTTFVLFGSLFLTTGCPGPKGTTKPEPAKPEPAKPGGVGDNVPGPASKLVFMTQPSGGTTDSAWARQPKVAVQDASGKTVTASLADVTLALVSSGSGSESGRLEGGSSAKAKEGVASFLDLSVRKVGKYTLKASSPNLADAVSDNFEITHGAATQLVFTKQPGEAAIKTAFGSQPVVAIRDAHGNPVISGADAEAILTIELLNPSAGAKLEGGTSSKAALGVASWSGLSINAAGDYTLTVKKPDLTAKGGVGPLSANSNLLSIKFPGVTSLTARGDDRKVLLKWDAAAGAVSYKVLRGDKADALTLVKPSLTNEYKDVFVENGKIYFYAVQAVYQGEKTSDNSQTVQVQPLSRAVITKTEVNDIGGGGALVVSWEAASTAGASSYTVKYSLVSGKAEEGEEGCTVEVSKRTCVVGGLTPEKTYYLTVVATNNDSGQAASPEANGIPHAVPTLKLTGTDGQKGAEGLFMTVDAQLYLNGRTARSNNKRTVRYGTASGVYTKEEVIEADGFSVSVSEIDRSDSEKTYYFKATEEFSNGTLSTKERSITATPGPGFTSTLPGDGRMKLEWTLTKNAERHVITCVNYTDSAVACPAPFVGEEMNIEKGQTQTSMDVTGLTNLNKYHFSIKAVMSEDKVTKEVYVTKNRKRRGGTVEGVGVYGYPAKPEFLSLKDIIIEREVRSDGAQAPQTTEEVFLKEKDILKNIPEKFKSAFYPEERKSICGELERGCGAKIEVSYSDDVLTQVINGSGGVMPAPDYAKGLLFIDLDNTKKIEASYTKQAGSDGILLKFPVNQRGVAGTAKITIKLTYGLETAIGVVNFVLKQKL